jgi:hypothetical protein
VTQSGHGKILKPAKGVVVALNAWPRFPKALKMFATTCINARTANSSSGIREINRLQRRAVENLFITIDKM